VMSRFDPVTPDELIEDGDVLGVLDGATVVHIPGHTPGAIALHLAGHGVLLCGDAIDNRRGVLGPPPSPFTLDAEQAVASIRKVAQLDFEILCPGHGPPIAGGAGERVRAMAAGLET
jgi:glyoxylase-like metal-dependent hydrolase (beta-lactamase superfamily II)